MARSDSQIKLRFPIDMHQRIKDQAHLNNRSMNAEIVTLLEAALEGKFSNTDDIADAIAARVLDGMKGGA